MLQYFARIEAKIELRSRKARCVINKDSEKQSLALFFIVTTNHFSLTETGKEGNNAPYGHCSALGSMAVVGASWVCVLIKCQGKLLVLYHGSLHFCWLSNLRHHDNCDYDWKVIVRPPPRPSWVALISSHGENVTVKLSPVKFLANPGNKTQSLDKLCTISLHSLRNNSMADNVLFQFFSSLLISFLQLPACKECRLYSFMSLTDQQLFLARIK